MGVLVASEQDHLRGVIEAFRDLGAAAYERDNLPNVLDPAYAEIEVTRDGGGTLRAGGPVPTFGTFTITERSTSRNAAQLRELRDKIAGIEGLTVVIVGYVSTPIAFNGPAEPISPDDGWYVAFRTWTYALFPSS